MTVSAANQPVEHINQTDQAFQAQMLEGVSRTFALTIPQLPADLHAVVANAYLLCRTVDTIEDEPALTQPDRAKLCKLFTDVVNGKQPAQQLTAQLSPLLSDSTIPAEHQLIQELDHVIAITNSFQPTQYQALLLCVETMAHGMPLFQESEVSGGLATEQDFDQYCYYVAGCVGEMLTRLFCHYSPDIEKNREQLLIMSVSFGQGLQMTNILKDVWDDKKRNVCWLPRDIFQQAGFDLSELSTEHHPIEFQQGMSYLVTKAYQHLQDAFNYTLLIPAKEKGIRKFCLWAIGMALLTLQNIRQHLDFNDSNHVKISRNKVKLTIATTNLCVSNDRLLKVLFNWSSRQLSSPLWMPEQTTVNQISH